MALYMLQINRKLILTEAERHGIWLPYGEHKNKFIPFYIYSNELFF